jgi:hypothetical protein
MYMQLHTMNFCGLETAPSGQFEGTEADSIIPLVSNSTFLTGFQETFLVSKKCFIFHGV